MALGPGKYDAHATRVREETGARGVILIVLGAPDGGGFSVQADDLGYLSALPDLLRVVARDIEKEHLAGRV